MAITPSTCSTSSPLPYLSSSPHFTPIPEEEAGKDDEEEEGSNQRASDAYRHQPTPLHRSNPPPPATTRSSRREDLSVSCSKCRPSSRDKISVVPLDLNAQKRCSSDRTPNGLLRSIYGVLVRKSPLYTPTTPPSSSATEASGDWKLTAAELSRKLVHVTRKRDEALLEASRLKYSVSELEDKLNRLESYCRDLRASLDSCAAGSTPSDLDPFRLAVSNARTAVRHLSRSLLAQLRASPRSMDRLGSLFHSHGVERQNPGGLIIGLESALNRVFYSDFEQAGEGEGMLPDPAARCAANRSAYEVVRGLSWENVLSMGTRHYSEGLSRFCDWKMSEVVAMLGCARAWPEVLLQAFFGAARAVWAVYLLARSVHPALPILRVDPGAQFDPRYMEDVAGGKQGAGELRMMVAPGFYLYVGGCSTVLKCRVVVAAADRRVNGRSGGPEISRIGVEKI